MADDSWALAEAKAKLSEVVEKAASQGPQHLTRHGREVAVVISTEDYRRLSSRPGRGLAGLYDKPGFLTEEEHDEIFVKSRDRSTSSRKIDF